jgi:hypothetical protein
VEEWVGAALAVLVGAAGAGEAHAFVEGEGAFILFIHVGRHGRVEGKAMFDERAADAFAVPVGIDEERLHMRAVDQHEADGAVVRVGGEPCGRLGQEGGHFLIDRVAIGGLEKIVGRIDGAAPDVDEAGAIGGAGRTDRYHGHAYSDEAAQTKGRATDERLSAARGARPDGWNFGF